MYTFVLHNLIQIQKMIEPREDWMFSWEREMSQIENITGKRYTMPLTKIDTKFLDDAEIKHEYNRKLNLVKSTVGPKHYLYFYMSLHKFNYEPIT